MNEQANKDKKLPQTNPANTLPPVQNSNPAELSNQQIASKIYPTKENNFSMTANDIPSEIASNKGMTEKAFNKLLFILFLLSIFFGPLILSLVLILVF
jgi:hypothetical protein